MSRTRHHRNQRSHHAGEDLWSRRIGGHLSYCAYSKFLTRRKERRAKRKDIEKEIRESE